jgi:hypothetical protein
MNTPSKPTGTLPGTTIPEVPRKPAATKITPLWRMLGWEPTTNKTWGLTQAEIAEALGIAGYRTVTKAQFLLEFSLGKLSPGRFSRITSRTGTRPTSDVLVLEVDAGKIGLALEIVPDTVENDVTVVGAVNQVIYTPANDTIKALVLGGADLTPATLIALIDANSSNVTFQVSGQKVAVNAPDIDLQDVPLEVRTAVVGGTFNDVGQLEPALDGDLLAASLRGMYFVDSEGSLYVYMFGSDGLPNWCKFAGTKTVYVGGQPLSGEALLAVLDEAGSNVTFALFDGKLQINTAHSRPVLYLYDYEQTEAGERGNPEKPFATWAALYDAAQEGDTVYVSLPKRADNSVVYDDDLFIRKSLNIICEKGVEFSGYVDTPARPSTLPYSRLRFQGAKFTGGLMLRRNLGGATSSYWVDCVFDFQGAEIYHRNYGATDRGVNTHYFTRCEFYSDGSIFHFEARAFFDGQNPQVYSESVDIAFFNCHLETTSNTAPVFYGNISAGYNISLIADTHIVTPSKVEKVDLSVYTNSIGLDKTAVSAGIAALNDMRYPTAVSAAPASSLELLNFLANDNTRAVSAGAVLRETVQVYGPQTITGQKTFQSAVRAVSYDSPDGKMSIGFADVGVALRSPVLPLTNLYFEALYQGVQKSFYWRFEGRNGPGFQGDPKGFIVNDLDANCGEMMLCDTHEQNFSNDYNAFISLSPNVALFRKRVKVGIGTDTPTERLDVGGNIKGFMHIFNNVTTEPGAKADGGIMYVQDGALKFKGSNGTVTVIAPA